MLSILVYIFFFVLLFILLNTTSEESKLLILLIGLCSFPVGVAFSISPYLDPKTILLYSFFLSEFIKRPNDVMEDIKSFPFKIPCAVLFVSFILTAYLGADGSLKKIYDACRIFIDSFGFMLAAFIAGRYSKSDDFLYKFSFFVLFLCVLGIIEHFLHDNYPYKIICSAFPYYNGFVGLNGPVNFDQNWRSRICILTKHPTTLGTLMTILFLTYLPLKITENFSLLKKLLVLTGIGLIIVFSGSRTALFCTIIFAIYFFTMKINLAIRIGLLVVFLSAIAYFGHAQIEELTTRGEGSSLELRQEQLLYSYIQFLNSPYFGNGLNYIETHLIEEDENGKRSVENLGGLESIVFTLLINQGIVGFVFYFLLLGWIAIFFWKQGKDNIQPIQGFLVSTSATLTFILSGHIGGNEIMCYTMIGFLAGASMIERPSDTSDSKDNETNDSI